MRHGRRKTVRPLSDFLKDDVDTFLADFGEDVQVIGEGDPRTIKAIVDRPTPGVGRDGRRLEGRITIEVINDAVKGISTASIDLGKTRVRLPERLGVPARPEGFLVSLPDGSSDWQDAGMITLVLK